MAVPKGAAIFSNAIEINIEIAHTFSQFATTFSEIFRIFATKRVLYCL